MIKAILVDDEEHCLDTLTMLINEYCPEVEILEQCASAKKALTAIEKYNPELVFLDIEMPVMNGFELLEQLNEINFSIVPGEKFNSFRGPTFKDVDLSISREFHFGERYRVTFRAESFNILNHPNFQQNVVDNVQYIANDPVANPTNPTDQLWTVTPNSDFGAPGAIVPKFGSRSFQFSAKFSF